MTHRFDATAGERTADTITAWLTARLARSPSGIGRWVLACQERWEPRTWLEEHASSAAIARGLRAFGLEPGQAVAIMAAGGADWDRVHLGVLGARGIVVGLDVHTTAVQLQQMFAVLPPVGLVVDDLSALRRIGNDAMAAVRLIIVLRPGVDQEVANVTGRTVVSLPALQEAGQRAEAQPWDQARPDDPAWVIFTSGTTGQPKGLLYCHRQVCLAVDAILDVFDDIAEGARLVSWLPLSNPFQRIINLCAMARGAQVYYVSDPRDVMRHLAAIRPQVFIGVPRFFEKFYAGAMAMLQGNSSLRSSLIHWALGAGARYAERHRAGRVASLALRFEHRLADGLVLRHVRAAFGGELRYLVSGSAAMPVWLLERLHAMGLLVLEAYGLSECVVPVAANRAASFRFGTVGHAMKGNEVRLAPDGELLLRSEGVFGGYLGSADDTGSPVDAQGFLATGDYAEIDAEGFIRLIGRKSEVFKTSTGRRVAPGAVEAVLRSVPGVEHAAVFGAGRQSLLAVVSVGGDAPATPEAMRNAIRSALGSVSDHQHPAGLVVSRRPFTIEAGELTGNLKLRRDRIGERYAAALAALAFAVDAPEVQRRRTSDEFEPGLVDLLVL